jgi:hypothetical protein
MAIYDASVEEGASVSAIRSIGGGYSTAAFSSGPFTSLGDSTRVVSGDSFATRVVFNTSVSATVSASISFTPARFSFVTVEEAAQNNEVLNASTTTISAVTEVAVVDDASSIRVGFAGIVSESAGTSEVVVRELAIAVFEAASVVTTREVGGGFSTGSFASGPFGSLGDISRTASGDFFNTFVQVNSAGSEQVVLTEVQTNNINVPSSVSEAGAVIVDSVIALPEYPGSVSEGAQVDNELPNAAIDFACNWTDQAVTSETHSAIVELVSLIDENGVASDVYNAAASLQTSVSESVDASENVPTNAQLWINIQESVLSVDQLIARSLWEPVDTSESSDWVLIDTVN